VHQTVITTIGHTLEPFDKLRQIPVFGFGDATTGDQSVFSFQPNGRPCAGLDEVLERYDVLTPQLALGGPTNFAPIIYEAIRRVKATNEYHILVIIAGASVVVVAVTAANADTNLIKRVSLRRWASDQREGNSTSHCRSLQIRAV
jgi:E3 ubiquitin-protein ligase RGLG